MAKTRDDYVKLSKRIAITLALAYAVSLVFFFGYSLFTFPEKHFLPPFRPSWTFLQTIAYFIDTLIPVHCSAVLVVCSLFAAPVPALKSGLQEAFRRLLFSTVAVFVLFGVLHVALTEGFLPTVYRRLSELENQTTIARSYLKLAEELAEEAETRENKKLREAYLEYYLSIDPGNTMAVKSLANLRKQPTRVTGTAEEGGQRRQARLLDMNVEELFARTQQSLDREDYYTALYFADLALALSPRGSEEANRARALTNDIQKELSEFTADTAELEKNAMFELKTQGHSDLSSEEVNLVIRGYYTFMHLRQRDPDDSESAKYLKIAREKLKTMAFFRDEVEPYGSMPGINRLFFTSNSKVVAIGGIISTDDGRFARDIEVISFSDSGEVTAHFKTSAGKIDTDENGGTVMYLVGVDRTDSSNTLLPEYYIGEPQDTLSLSPSIEELELLGSEGRDIESHYLSRLMRMWDIVAPYGYAADPIQIATLRRVAFAFTLIILSLFTLTLGWKLRPAGAFPILTGIIVVPIFPFAAFFLVRAYEYVLTLLIGSSLLAWGFIPSLIVLIALNFALLVFSIAVLASQLLTSRESQSL